MKRKKSLIWTVIIVGLAGAAYGIFGAFNGNGKTQMQFGMVTRGDLENTISCSGTLSPVTTVDVGTQVSGIIDRVFVDYNDIVTKGQLLAVLDTFLLKASLLDAEAGVERAEAELEQARADYARGEQLHEKGLISDADYLSLEIAVKAQNALVKSAEAALTRARSNLDYAYVYSPIDGTVIEKNIEEGQTVAASLSAPTLFLIAEDLSHMEILADVDESDIGDIKVGQETRFEVPAYSDQTFTGRVTQIRLQPENVSNVVTYTVVIDAANDEGLLLPGMTATVDFIIQQKNDVLLVPNAALRIQPTEDMSVAVQKKRQQERPPFADADSTATTAPGGQRPGMVPGTGNKRPANMSLVWFLDSDGQLSMEPVLTGMTDGSITEIVRSRSLDEGMQIVTAVTGSTSSTKATNATQGGLMGGRSSGGPPSGPPGF
ncbi:MAG: efflux RND transporter periplasmic adaptor subunit [candidate division Zixibacteria bacterium]|nr:efflux RND transporter periplasmic adaptor subunit [candidate division Zixibacteria bacterium]